MNINMGALTADLFSDENARLFVYDDATGKPVGPGDTLIGNPTIGIGRALNTTGITMEEASFLLDNDESSKIQNVGSALPWIGQLSELRQRILVEMAFNMGVGGLLTFRQMLAALQAGNYDAAATKMLQSDWATQVPARARRLALRMSSGEDQ
jgi:lysozyme